jgi:UDP-glucose 4-epimerase
MLADLNVAFGPPWMAFRYFNAAGADSDGELGEVHDPETHLVPLVLGAARGGPPVRILGNDYDTPDGTCVRDYIHVSDIADAPVLGLTHLLAGGKNSALNLANSRGYSVKEVIEIVEGVCGCTIPWEFSARRPGDAPILIGDAALAHKLLGWKPVRSGLENQVQDAWNWLKHRE